MSQPPRMRSWQQMQQLCRPFCSWEITHFRLGISQKSSPGSWMSTCLIRPDPTTVTNVSWPIVSLDSSGRCFEHLTNGLQSVESHFIVNDNVHCRQYEMGRKRCNKKTCIVQCLGKIGILAVGSVLIDFGCSVHAYVHSNKAYCDITTYHNTTPGTYAYLDHSNNIFNTDFVWFLSKGYRVLIQNPENIIINYKYYYAHLIELAVDRTLYGRSFWAKSDVGTDLIEKHGGTGLQIRINVLLHRGLSQVWHR